MRYFRPKSLTWWSSMIAIALGALGFVCSTCDLGELSKLIVMLNGGGDNSPASLVMLGLVGIGLHDKFERSAE